MNRFRFDLPVVLILLSFLILSCASQPVGQVKDDESPAGSLKTVDGKGSKEKGQAESSIISKDGKCVYGCPPKGNPQTLASPVPAPSAAAVSSDYLLGSEDIIEVSVWKNENLSRVVGIRPDGKISLPLIGDVQAAGLTTAQVRESIKDKLREFKESPEVSIIVREINSLVVYITGEILHPGKLLLRSDTSVLQAIIMAGGFTQYASPNSIVLLRRVKGIETRKVIRYKDIVSGAKPDDDVILQRGDTIVVP